MEYQIIVDGWTRDVLGRMARKHGLTYGQMVELLVMEEIEQGRIDVPDSVDPRER